MKSILIAAVSVSFMASALAVPQTADVPPVPTLHADARVVQIDVVVTDPHGKPVTDLTKADFTITDNGKPRAIDIFSINRGSGESGGSAPASAVTSTMPKRSLPPHVFSNRNPGPPDIPGHATVIVLDQVNAYLADAAQGRQAVIDLMAKVKPDERIALYVIAKNLGLLLIQDYSTDRALLVRNLSKYIPRGLAALDPSHPDMKSVADQPGPPDASRSTRSEDDYDWRRASEQARLSLQTLAEHLALVPGRKSVFWVTHGFPARLMQGMGKPAWEKTVTALNEANVAVNTVDSRGLYGCSPPQCDSFNPWTGSITTLQEVAEQTGGTAYFGRNDLTTGMANVIEASRATYTLAFYLPDNERDASFHTLKVKADRTGLELYYRQGYYAGGTELPAAYDKTAKGDLEASLLNQVNSTGVGITARVESVSGPSRAKLGIRLNLDPTTVSLTAAAGGWTVKVEELLVQQNESGNILSRVTDVRSLDIPRAKRANFDRDGALAQFEVPLAPGATKLTIVVRDTKSGHVGSLTVPLK